MPKTYVFTAFGGPETQQFVDWPRPEPGAGQLVVKVRAAGVNPTDWKGRANVRGEGTPPTRPQPFGREVSGIVEALGAGVEGFALGDEVFGTPVANGGYSEYSVLSVDEAALKPANVSFLDAATLPVAAATAYDGIVQLQLVAGETLLVIGIGGGVGIAAAQIAISRGARVLGTASASKRELVESIGAVHVAYGEGVVERVRAVAPEGIDALYDMVGGDALRELAPLVTDKARLLSVGDSRLGVELGGPRIERARNSAVLREVAKLAASGALRPSVTTVFPLDRAAEALALVEDGHATGKVVIEVA
jgi:NADPH:quinone reductase-like Zn-dependent oxidoreductase